jgi:hypothetical protein
MIATIIRAEQLGILAAGEIGNALTLANGGQWCFLG